MTTENAKAGTPDDDPVALWARIHRLEAQLTGPGDKPWCDIALNDKVARIKAEAALAACQRAITGPDEFGSVYVHFQPARLAEKGVVKKTYGHQGTVNLDYDADGKLFGIEILDVAALDMAAQERTG